MTGKMLERGGGRLERAFVVLAGACGLSFVVYIPHAHVTTLWPEVTFHSKITEASIFYPHALELLQQSSRH